MRHAVLIVSAELLRDGLGPLFDAGIYVDTSFEPAANLGPVVLLGVYGDALPPECEAREIAKVVSVEFTVECYGRQRITRLSAIRTTGQTLADVVAPPFIRAA